MRPAKLIILIQIAIISIASICNVFAASNDGVPIVVFNPLSWTRTDPVEVESPFPGESGNVVIADKAGHSCYGQNIGDLLHFTARNVPPIGYKIFWAKLTNTNAKSNIISSQDTVENQYYRVQIDKKRGIISSIYHKTLHKYIVAQEDGAAILEFRNPKNKAWENDLLKTGEVVLMEHGSAKTRVCMDHNCGDLKFVNELMLYDGIDRIDFRLTASIQNAISEPLIRVLFPLNIKNAKSTLGNQLGVADWKGSRTGICGVRWLDMSVPSYGMSLISDNKQGLDVDGSKIQMILSGPDFQLKAEGMYGFDYSLYTHSGRWQATDTLKRSFELTYPLVASLSKSNNTEVKSKQYLLSSTKDAMFRILRPKAEDGSLVLRLYEIKGKVCDISLRADTSVKHIQETDQKEKPIADKILVTNNKFSVRLRPHEIKTFKLIPS